MEGTFRLARSAQKTESLCVSLRYGVDRTERMPVQHWASWIITVSDERVPSIHRDKYWKFGQGEVDV